MPPRKVVKRVPSSRSGASTVGTSSAFPSSRAVALPTSTADDTAPQTPKSSTSIGRTSMPVRTPLGFAQQAPNSSSIAATTRFVPPPQLQRQSLLAQQMEDALLRDDDDDDGSSGSGRDPVERFLQSLQPSSSPPQSPPSKIVQPPPTQQSQQQQQDSLAPNQRRLAQQLEDALLQDFSDDVDSGDSDPTQRFMNSLQKQQAQEQQPVVAIPPSSSSSSSSNNRSSATNATPIIPSMMARASTDDMQGDVDESESSSAYTADRIESFIQTLRAIRKNSKESSDSTTTALRAAGGFASEERPVVKETLGTIVNQKSSSVADDAESMTISSEVQALEERRRMSRQLDADLKNENTESIENLANAVQNTVQERAKEEAANTSRSSSVPLYFANSAASKNDDDDAWRKTSKTTSFKPRTPTTEPPAWLLGKDQNAKTNEDLERLETRILDYLTAPLPSIQVVAETGKEGISFAVDLAAKATPILSKGVEFARNLLDSAATAALYKRTVDTAKASNPLEGLMRSVAKKIEDAAAAATWNELENQRDIQTMESRTSVPPSIVASSPKNVSGVDLIPDIAQKLSPSYVFQQRNRKVASASKAGQSRWGNMENQQAIQMVDGTAAAGETSAAVPATAETKTGPIARGSAADSTLYLQRNRKVAAAAVANQSRWGEMENRKVAKMMGIPLPLPVASRAEPPTPAVISPRGTSTEQLAREWAARNRDGSDDFTWTQSPIELKPSLPAVRDVVSSSSFSVGVVSTGATNESVARADGDGELSEHSGSKATGQTINNEQRNIDKVDRVAFLRKLQAESQTVLIDKNWPKIDRSALLRKLMAPPDRPPSPYVEPITDNKTADWEQKYAGETLCASPVETPEAYVKGWKLARESDQRNSESTTVAKEKVMSTSSPPALSSAGRGDWEHLANEWARMNRDQDSPTQSIQSKRGVPSDVSLDKGSRKDAAWSSTKSCSPHGDSGWEQLASEWARRNREQPEYTRRPDLYVVGAGTDEPPSPPSVADRPAPETRSAVAIGGWEQLASEWAKINAIE
jgi:hypothetical protein